MAMHLQGSLFDQSDDLRLGPLDGLRRRDLGAGAWVDLLPGWLGGETLRFPQGHGGLIVMGGSCQRTWDHTITKSTRAVGPRISIQFRPRGVR